MEDSDEIKELKLIKAELVKTIKWYLGIISLFFMGFFAIQQAEISGIRKQQAESELNQSELKQDFGYTVGAMKEKHPESAVFDDIHRKYSSGYRSGTAK